MAFPVVMPSGYNAPSLFDAYLAVTSSGTSYTALQRLQNNMLSVGYDLNHAVPIINTINTNLTVTGNNLNTVYTYIQTAETYNKAKFQNISTKLSKPVHPVTFANISTKLTALDAKVANMQPEVITQSLSFLLGAFVALAFVLAAKMRF